MKKEQLLESDFSMCLGMLWKYELDEPTDDASNLVAKSIQLKKNYVFKSNPSQKIEEPKNYNLFQNLDMMFDLDSIGDENELKENAARNAINKAIESSEWKSARKKNDMTFIKSENEAKIDSNRV